MADNDDNQSALLSVPVVVEVPVGFDAKDVVNNLNNNDEMILTFICQILALSESVELRESLKERLTDNWEDSEYV